MNAEPGAAVDPNKALWEKGDFTRIAASMRESGEALVSELGLTPGLEVPSAASSSASRDGLVRTATRGSRGDVELRRLPRREAAHEVRHLGQSLAAQHAHGDRRAIPAGAVDDEGLVR